MTGGAQGNLTLREEVQTLWNGDLGSMSARVPFLAGTGNTHCAGCLHPGFSVNLHGKGFGGVEGDLRALGQPMSSILELGIDLAHLNCTLQPYYFQPLVT